MDNIKLADQHLIGKFVSMSPDVDCDEIVASTDVEIVSASVMYRITKLCAQTLPRYNLHVAGNVVDAAGPNWKALLADSTHSAKDILPRDLMNEFPSVDFGIRHISVDQLTDEPIVHIPDPMHCSKTVCTALENSSSTKSQRSLYYGQCPMSLKMVETCWLATGGGTVQMDATKLSAQHFNKDNNSRMDVPLAMQVLSASTARMMRKAVDDPALVLGTFRQKEVFKPLIILIEKWDKLVDIMNGRNYNYTPENGCAVQRELLTTLAWFTKWKNKHDKLVAAGKRNEYNFLAAETWSTIQMMILSHVVLIELYCIRKKMVINPHRINTDPCEHHFGNGRQSIGGSTNGMTTAAWGNADCKSGLAKASQYNAVGNNRESIFTKSGQKKRF